MPVIGYDCNGKPLHPGDRCVLISSKGLFAQVSGLRPGDIVEVEDAGGFCGEPSLIIKNPKGTKSIYELHCQSKDLRKLPKDQHRSADRSFEDLMRGIKTLMPETNHL